MIFDREITRAISIDMDYVNRDVENEKVRVHDLETLKERVQEGITYDEVKEFLGGVDGVLVEKTSVTNKYIWRHPSGANVSAAFQLDEDVCNSFVGVE